MCITEKQIEMYVKRVEWVHTCRNSSLLEIITGIVAANGCVTGPKYCQNIFTRIELNHLNMSSLRGWQVNVQNKPDLSINP